MVKGNALQKMQEVRKIEQRTDFRNLKLDINLDKMYHKMFHRYLPGYLPKEIYEKLFPPIPAPPTPAKPIKEPLPKGSVVMKDSTLGEKQPQDMAAEKAGGANEVIGRKGLRNK